MEIIKNLLIRLRHTGALILIGFLLIIYIALGFVYWQQGPQQREFEKQIVKLSAIVSKPLPSKEKLQAEYDGVNLALAPMPDSAAIAILVSIAEENGLNIVTLCTGCFESLAMTNKMLKDNSKLKEKVNRILNNAEKSFTGSIEVKHYLQVLLEDIGFRSFFIYSIIQASWSLI